MDTQIVILQNIMTIFWCVMSKSIFEGIPHSNNRVIFSLFLLTICNLRCEYCYARRTKKWNEMLSRKGLEKILNYLRNVNFDFEITLLGGEPTLYPYLSYVIDELNLIEKCKVIEVFTNGMKYFDFKSDKLILNVSYHKTSVKFNWEIFIKNINIYKNKYKNLILCSPQPLTKNELDEFKGINIHYQNIINDTNPIAINNDINDVDLFRYNGNIVDINYIAKNRISFKRLKCDMYNFLLDQDGIVDECNQKRYRFINNLKITRVCESDCCFKNGDFLLYNRKYIDE